MRKTHETDRRSAENRLCMYDTPSQAPGGPRSVSSPQSWRPYGNDGASEEEEEEDEEEEEERVPPPHPTSAQAARSVSRVTRSLNRASAVIKGF